MAAIHETMEALHKIGAIDKETMRHFHQACLTQVCHSERSEESAFPVRREQRGVLGFAQNDRRGYGFEFRVSSFEFPVSNFEFLR